LDNGRVMRPLFTVENSNGLQQLKIKKKHIRRLQLDDNKEYNTLK